MQFGLDFLVVLIILTSFKLVSSSRLTACVMVVALQGLLLSLAPLLVGMGHLTWRIAFLSLLTMAVKGVAFPWLLLKVLRTANVSREAEPFIDYTTSLLVGVGLLVISIWLGRKLPLPIPSLFSLVVPLALFNVMVGLFIIVSRRKALTQVLGYLVMENGIYAFGLAFAVEETLLVELGTLLDVFMAVFIMGIMIFHINRELDHIDADRLSELKD